jgi:Sec7-like guanine-nucleotide exchange factor
MYDMEVDKALRQLMCHFRLPGESDKIDYLMQVKINFSFYPQFLADCF